MSGQGYTPSPRPTFEGPAHIPYAGVTRYLWGDAESGEVADWIYVSSDKMHHLRGRRVVLCAQWRDGDRQPGDGRGPSGARRPGGRLRPRHLAPCLRLRHRAVAGAGAVRPAAQQRDLRRVCPHQTLPPDAPLHPGSVAGSLARCPGGGPAGPHHPRGARGGRPQITAGIIHLLPGQHSEPQSHGGDEGLYLRAGSLHIRLPGHQGQRWFELQAGDGFYIPAGVPHQYYNISDRPVDVIFGVAPRYLP
jgi:quercetin dioxygenase-like cupin family protein